MRIIDSFQLGVSFWEVNPQFLVSNPFKRIHSDDRSTRKKNSSVMMWFVVMCYDLDSKYEGLEIKEKHSIVGEDFCGSATYYEDNKELIEEVRIAYCKLMDTPAKRSLRNWKYKLEERDEFISKTPFTMDYYEEDERSGRMKTIKGTADQLDKMLANTKKLWDDYERIMEAIAKEENQSGEGKGGSMASASDEGTI